MKSESSSTKPGAESPPPRPLGLFQGFGVELEYMIVGRGSLDLVPAADAIMAAAAGAPVSEVELGEIAWSNELVLHVLEMKTNGPAPSLEGLASLFLDQVAKANALLTPIDAVLLPTGMHPWMDPLRETRLWPHEYTEVYRSYDRIFGCRGHGWSNLQSTHINLPFNDNDEFVRLHAAIRVVLPLIPALAASTPVVEGRLTGLLDNRLEFYRNNQGKVPEIAGQVVPEVVRSVDEYHGRILKQIFRAIAPFDPEGILQHEWLNSRGAIARFDRSAIEIRLVDIQECPGADLAVVAAIVAAVRALAEETWVPVEALHQIPTEPLKEILLDAIRRGEAARVDDPAILATFGRTDGPVRAGDLWLRIIGERVDRDVALQEGWFAVYEAYAKEGTLARRMAHALGSPGGDAGAAPAREKLTALYRQLADGLAQGSLFAAAGV